MKLLYIQPWNFSDEAQKDRYSSSQLSSISIPRAMFEVLYGVKREVEIDILDLNLELLERADSSVREIVFERIHKIEFDAVFINFPAVALGNIIADIVLSIRDADTTCDIVVGGQAVTLMKEDVLRFWPVNYCYVGDGVEIPQIVDFLESNLSASRDIPGFFSSIDGKIESPQVENGESGLIDGYLPYDLYSFHGRFNFQAYLERYRRLGLCPTACLEMTRGCSYECDFCSICRYGGVRYRDPETVVQEAEYLMRYGVNEFYLIDPTLGLDRQSTDILLNRLADLKGRMLNMKLRGITRCDHITPEFAGRLVRAGFETVTLGIESMDEHRLGRIGKRSGSEKGRVAVRILEEYGIRSRLSIIHFPDGFSVETVRFLAELSDSRVTFIVQSSFYRPTYRRGAFPEPPDFRQWDQRVDARSLGLDSDYSVLEWLICNLGFPSTDVDNRSGRSGLVDRLGDFTFSESGTVEQQCALAVISNEGKYYLYKPEKPLQMLKPFLWEGDNICELDEMPVKRYTIKKRG